MDIVSEKDINDDRLQLMLMIILIGHFYVIDVLKRTTNIGMTNGMIIILSACKDYYDDRSFNT